jgi:hypothetical protein
MEEGRDVEMEMGREEGFLYCILYSIYRMRSYTVTMKQQDRNRLIIKEVGQV